MLALNKLRKFSSRFCMALAKHYEFACKINVNCKVYSVGPALRNISILVGHAYCWALQYYAGKILSVKVGLV